MPKIKLTKNELKKQKDSLKRFQRYLPTLQLKKQQLQTEIRRIESERKKLLDELHAIQKGVEKWVQLFAEDPGIHEILKTKDIITERSNIAGIDIPVFKDIEFTEKPYDLFAMPLWIDRALVEIKKMKRLSARISVLDEQNYLISEELRITSQRVNLFEKVKIPESMENIRKIQIFLGDQQTAAVVRGKISKNKIVRAS